MNTHKAEITHYLIKYCTESQELSWMDGKRAPLDGKRLKMYIMSMREVVEAYRKRCIVLR